MTKECTTPGGEMITKGDAVCVVGFDTIKQRPIVKRATRDNLSTSKTVFGVAEDIATGGSVCVLVAGEVAETTVTSLGAGYSRIIATDTDQLLVEDQCRLKRIDRPDGSEFVVGTCDESGNLVVQPSASRETSNLHVFNVRSYGAIPDWTPTNLSPTDNLPFFQAALAAMVENGNRGAKLVADGHFFLSDTLVLTQTIVFEGTGQNEPPPFFEFTRSTPGTMLIFPSNVTGIRIRGGATLDNPTKTLGNRFPPSGEKTILRNMTVFCKDGKAPDCTNPDISEAKKCRDEEDDCSPEGECIHGIHASTMVRIENVTVEFFSHDGIHIVGAECGKSLLDENAEPVLDGNGNPIRVYDGNADTSYVENCQVGACGRDGFHFRGGDANACVITRCSGVVNGRAGFYDETFGNTYLGCHAEGNCGPNYITRNDSNASVFINCWSEGGGSPPSEFKGQVTIISGKIGGNPQYMSADSSAFILEHGVATRAPLVYKNLAGKKSIGVSLGDMSQTTQGPGQEMIAFQWATLTSSDEQGIEDFTSLRYLAAPDDATTDSRYGWWALELNNSFYRHMIRFPTQHAKARLPAPWFPNGIFISEDTTSPTISFTAAKVPREFLNDAATPRTYEHGDIVWNSEPSAGGPIGWVCTTSGTQGTPTPATLVPFGSVRGAVSVDVTVNTTLEASYETIKLIGNLTANTIITVPSEDGWSARFLDLTTRNGHALKVNVATSPGIADYILTNGQTQRLFIEYDHSVLVYNIRPEGPPA